ncbi:class I SAM-dependent methyltransferase [Streptomyces koyangensis]|uniref:Methyltransferase domain-containing protein n=1 Tax=Streptomyces koyangensis TaxID=188770 RepID=A0ABX7EMF2_9ACTN|nr:class I SAM-dependent methyltransferase [Streptomyces koyangensis]QRF05907.1 methyltransferase domain-containing protein [Streptomyces koyangensis]
MTEPSHLTAVRTSHDTVSSAYADLVSDPAALDPLSRATLTAFAEIVRDSGLGPVADLGCGPGHLTARLASLGVAASGVDVSPAMVELARATHPGLRFSVGTMTALEIGDATLGGVLAHYSTHHTPPELLPTVFAEFHRTLAPGGHLLLAGHVGAGTHRRPTHAYGGHPVSYTSHRLPPDRLAALLREAGFTVTAQLTQEPDAELTWSFASFMARKEGAGRPA